MHLPYEVVDSFIVSYIAEVVTNFIPIVIHIFIVEMHAIKQHEILLATLVDDSAIRDDDGSLPVTQFLALGCGEELIA